MRPDVHAMKQQLNTYTSLVWTWRDGQFVSQDIEAHVADRLQGRDTKRGEHRESDLAGAGRVAGLGNDTGKVRLTLTFDTAQDLIDTIAAERGSLKR